MVNPAQRRYNRRIIALGIVYALLLFGAVALFVAHLLHGALAYVVAILPSLPIVGMFVAIGRYLVEETDEYIRDWFVRQALIATGFSLSIATVWGFLENFDLVPHVYAYYAAILWFAGLGVGSCANALLSRRSRA
ncbi:hypothetical protein [uncultured Sphingomonas sp.]|uniref:hypothetical protein n=1 Tax=uncultured Sphingomonas sp. TaxID=158754 RepID=UPI0035C99506